ncbi:hypothetical protein L207DRAFT_187189 [Hyaloscypha variabilis F]|uniref:Uncharacterized protein n=1 Tax=Hyaloscypha variabilis (strain UAMH 11265 / GT02V1 / F) TaxID=1149755 RepID=A0A2J6R018_HYAVF|nr:hypothetical protein L207DRAFT_187189 [Hyaloscypha variabilis F]
MLSLLLTIPASQVPLGIPQRIHSVGNTRPFTSYDLLDCLHLLSQQHQAALAATQVTRLGESNHVTSPVACIANIFPECSSSPPPARKCTSQSKQRRGKARYNSNAMQYELRCGSVIFPPKAASSHRQARNRNSKPYRIEATRQKYSAAMHSKPRCAAVSGKIATL